MYLPCLFWNISPKTCISWILDWSVNYKFKAQGSRFNNRSCNQETFLAQSCCSAVVWSKMWKDSEKVFSWKSTPINLEGSKNLDNGRRGIDGKGQCVLQESVFSDESQDSGRKHLFHFMDSTVMVLFARQSLSILQLKLWKEGDMASLKRKLNVLSIEEKIKSLKILSILNGCGECERRRGQNQRALLHTTLYWTTKSNTERSWEGY